MVLPLIPLTIAGLGIGTGFGLSSLFGGKDETPQEAATGKKDIEIVPTEVHAAYERYQPTYTISPSYEFGYQAGDILIESPGASTKKEMTQELTSEPTTSPTFTQPHVVEIPVSTSDAIAQEATSGTNMVLLVAIGAVALVAYGLVSKK